MLKEYKVVEDGIEYEVRENLAGDKVWSLNGKRHRKNGPAIEYNNGEKHYYKYGKYHRTDGPAVIWSNGKEYWLDDKQYFDIISNEEWMKLVPIISIIV